MSSDSSSSVVRSATASTVLTVSLSPAFKLVFVSVLAITILCLLLACSLVGFAIRAEGSLPPPAQELMDLSTSMFKLGFGAIVGLLGGKAL